MGIRITAGQGWGGKGGRRAWEKEDEKDVREEGEETRGERGLGCVCVCFVCVSLCVCGYGCSCGCAVGVRQRVGERVRRVHDLGPRRAARAVDAVRDAPARALVRAQRACIERPATAVVRDEARVVLQRAVRAPLGGKEQQVEPGEACVGAAEGGYLVCEGAGVMRSEKGRYECAAGCVVFLGRLGDICAGVVLFMNGV